MLRSKWLVVAIGLALVGVMGLAPRAGVSANEVKGAGELQVRLLLDGKVMGTFTEVSGLDMQVEVLEVVCRVHGGGVDDDCDGIAADVWQADLLGALWGIELAAADLEEAVGSRSGHDMAMNAIRNIKARAHEAAHTIQQGGSLKTKHDTVKNSVGNIRAAFRVLSGIAIDETGVHAAVRELGGKVDALNESVTQRTIKKRPGRPVFGNITLTAPLGQNQELAAWWNDAVNGKSERKSGSIIYLDRAGNEVARYNFFECWPVAFSTSMAIEKIEIAVEKVERAK